jgi:signal transduction histidine kinase
MRSVAVAGLAALLAGAAGVLLAGRIARPVEEVAAAAEAVQAGDLQHTVLTGAGFAEGQRLAQAFNAMMARLQQAEQAKNAFIADVSHELRTPLTVIKGTVETLEDGALDDVEGRGPLLRSMQAETERLIRMVNELLVLTRAGAGNLHLDCERLDAGQVAHRRADGLRKLAAERGISIVVTAEAELWVWADVDRLAQVLDNLLDNALRYAPAGSVVQVRVWGEAERVWFAVQDDGPGIDAQHLPLIFERFYRVDGSRTRQTGGTGLGLAIVRSLVLAQGGQIEALSAPGHGTTMRFWLPKVAD